MKNGTRRHIAPDQLISANFGALSTEMVPESRETAGKPFFEKKSKNSRRGIFLAKLTSPRPIFGILLGHFGRAKYQKWDAATPEFRAAPVFSHFFSDTLAEKKCEKTGDALLVKTVAASHFSHFSSGTLPEEKWDAATLVKNIYQK